MSDEATNQTNGAPELTEQVYAQLRAIAQRKLMEERGGHTLQATALVNEAFLRMQTGGVLAPLDKVSFYWAAAEAMRRVLIDHARARGAAKRGGGAKRAEWSEDVANVCDLASLENSEQIEALDAAILRLVEEDQRAGEVVKLRFFAGLSVEEAAGVMQISERMVKRDWEYARAFLLRELGRLKRE